MMAKNKPKGKPVTESGQEILRRMVCECHEFCERSGHFTDGSGAWFAPYVPSFIEGSKTICRRLDDPSMKSQPRPGKDGSSCGR